MAPAHASPPPPGWTTYLDTLLPRSVASTGSVGVGAGDGDWRAHASPEDLVLESWSQGYMVGSLIIMACITIANMRSKVLLHKLILLEQCMAMSHGTFCFMDWKGYGWYLSSTASLLYCSWVMHNVVAWMKIRPFFADPRGLFKPRTGKWVRNVYLSTLAGTVPPIIFQIYNNFRFFNNINDLYKRVRPYEPLMRDPWWIFTCLTLFHVIRKCYGTGVLELIKRSPRFGILLVSIVLSMCFTALDIASSINNFIGSTDGINPWWKLSLVFKCLTDTIMLDDFKTELKRLGIKRIQKEEKRRESFALVLDDKDEQDDRELEYADALNTNPARFYGKQSPHRSNSANTANLTDSPPGRLRQDSMEMKGSAEKRGAYKSSRASDGKKIGHLPGLKKFGLESIKSGKKAKGPDLDMEKAVPTTEAPSEKHDHDGPSDPNSSTERVNHMRKSLGVADFQTKPEGY